MRIAAASKALMALLVVAVLSVAAGCSSDDDKPASSSAPTTTESRDQVSLNIGHFRDGDHYGAEFELGTLIVDGDAVIGENLTLEHTNGTGSAVVSFRVVCD